MYFIGKCFTSIVLLGLSFYVVGWTSPYVAELGLPAVVVQGIYWGFVLGVQWEFWTKVKKEV